MKLEINKSGLTKKQEEQLHKDIALQNLINDPGAIIGVDSNESPEIQDILNKPEAFTENETGLSENHRDITYKILDNVIEDKLKKLSLGLQEFLSKEKILKEQLKKKLNELNKTKDDIEKNDEYIREVQNRLHPTEAEELLNEKLLILRRYKESKNELEAEIRFTETELINIDKNIDNILNQVNN